MKKRQIETVEDEIPDGDGAIGNLLIQSTFRQEHGQRWVDGAHRGHALHLLREGRAYDKKEATLPVWEYLAELAARVRISLDAVLAAMELDTQPVVSRGTVGRITDALRHIGCGTDEVLRMIRLSFAEIHGLPVSNELVVARRGRKEISGAGFCDEVLKRTESQYPEQLRCELSEIKSIVLRQVARGE